MRVNIFRYRCVSSRKGAPSTRHSTYRKSHVRTPAEKLIVVLACTQGYSGHCSGTQLRKNERIVRRSTVRASSAQPWHDYTGRVINAPRFGFFRRSDPLVPCQSICLDLECSLGGAVGNGQRHYFMLIARSSKYLEVLPRWLKMLFPGFRLALSSTMPVTDDVYLLDLSGWC